MSRHARALACSGRSLAWALLLAAPLAGAQTIADYSRAQSAWLQSTMSQAAARSAALGASAPAPGSAPSGPVATKRPGAMLPAPSPAVRVSGVFATGAGALAEIVVDATPYLLGAGQGVPGTAWRVDAVAVDKVVLARRAGVRGGALGAAARQVFALPALH